MSVLTLCRDVKKALLYLIERKPLGSSLGVRSEHSYSTADGVLASGEGQKVKDSSATGSRGDDGAHQLDDLGGGNREEAEGGTSVQDEVKEGEEGQYPEDNLSGDNSSLVSKQHLLLQRQQKREQQKRELHQHRHRGLGADVREKQRQKLKEERMKEKQEQQRRRWEAQAKAGSSGLFDHDHGAVHT